ncbi:HAMP domain-containing sensor histidine kinase [Catenuloplanes niger JCM 9533]
MMLLLIGGLLTVDVLAYLGLRLIQADEVEQTLTHAAARVAALPAGLPPVDTRLLSALTFTDLHVALIGGDGEVLADSGPISATDRPSPDGLRTVVPSRPDEAVTVTAPGGTDYRMIMVPAPPGTLVTRRDGGAAKAVDRVAIGYPLTAHQRTGRRLVVLELSYALLVLGAWTVLSSSFIRAGLRPLREISRSAEAIADGSRTERIAAGADDPELRHLVEALNHAFDARRRDEDRMRDFVADASHELRTPLAAVRGWTDLYRQGALRSRPDVVTAIDTIWQEANRMEQLVEDMLTLARLDAEITAPAAAVPVASLLAETTATARLLHQDHTYALRPGPPGLTVQGDPAALRRALSNLLVNAGRHTPAGCTVTVSAEHAGTHVEIRVEDDGPGLSAAQREVAFDRFWRDDRSRGRPGGTGLGLPISRSIARAAGGDLRLAESSTGGLAAVLVLPPAGA